MAKISTLPTAETVDGAEAVLVVKDGVTMQATLQDIAGRVGEEAVGQTAANVTLANTARTGAETAEAAAGVHAANAATQYSDMLDIQALGDDAAAIAARVPKNTDGSDFTQPLAIVENLQVQHEGTPFTPRSLGAWAREAMFTPADASAPFNGIDPDTPALQSLVDHIGTLPRGGALKFPRGATRHGPLNIPANVKIYHEGCETIPDLDTTTNQKLYNFTQPGCGLAGLKIEGYDAVLVGGIAKYMVFGDGCDGLLVEDLDLKDIIASDGLVGLLNKAVCHGAYIKNADKPRLLRLSAKNVSGAGFFTVNTVGLDVDGFDGFDIGWYQGEIGNDNFDYTVRNSRFWNESVMAGMYGGLFNIMGQTANAASTTENTIGTGVKAFTVVAGLTGLTVGETITAIATPGSVYMIGRVASYIGTTLIIDVTDTAGAGTYASWSIGSINKPDVWGRFIDNTIRGVCNYGAGGRILSASKLIVARNHFIDIKTGQQHLAGEPTACIAVDRRGTAVGAAESGPCSDLIFEGNIMEPGPGTRGHIGYTFNNQHKTRRDPHRRIQIRGGSLAYHGTDRRFRTAVSVNGGMAGIEGFSLMGLQADVLTDAMTSTTGGAYTTGAVSFGSSNAEGKLNGVQMIFCQITDKGTPSISQQTGLYAQAEIGDIRAQFNRFENFFFGLRTGPFIGSFRGGHDNEFVGCTNNLILGSPVNKQFSYGPVVPVLGTYEEGHIHYAENASAGVSNAWRCHVAGGAMFTTWSAGLSGSAVQAGRQTRNPSAGVVYGIVTAGPGVTANEPVHATVGQEVTMADGYKYRCLALTSARWSPVAADGAAVALP